MTSSIWRYVPRCDRSRAMMRANVKQQMEQEKLARETEEKDKAEKARKMKESFGDTMSQWEKDKTAIQDMALQEKEAKEPLEELPLQNQRLKGEARQQRGSGAEKADRR
jgi:mannan polymerase II complex ANP1 subunit